MRILVISNLYPPFYIGGYELACYAVVRNLIERGHEVSVLTSRYGIKKPSSKDDGVFRLLTPYFHHVPSIRTLLSAAVLDRFILRRVIDVVKPDIVFIWNMGGITRTLLFALQKRGLPIVYYLQDKWLIEGNHWSGLAAHQQKACLLKALRKFLTIFHLIPFFSPLFPYELKRLDVRYVCFVSRFLREKYSAAGFKIDLPKVIYNGIDLRVFSGSKEKRDSQKLGIIYSGRLCQEKGIYTLIDAFSYVIEDGCKDVTFTIVGEFISSEEKRRFSVCIDYKGLRPYITILPMVTQKELAALYRKNDIFVFPSLLEEGFPLSILEAMASGLAVVSTLAGGAREILTDEKNALVFPVLEARSCARQIKRLIADSCLRERIASSGQREVRERFTMEKTGEAFEAYLRNVLARSQLFYD